MQYLLDYLTLILNFHMAPTLIGTYESGIASYKHLYFNATENTMKIWILTVIAIIALYECAKHLINLMIHKSARYSMIFLFCLSIFSHYYAWWAYVNYYNDDFFSQWNHQTLFSVCVCNMLLIIFYFLNKISFKLELDLYDFNKFTIIPMITFFKKHIYITMIFF